MEIERPAAIVGFFHADALAGERVREVHEPLPKPERARRGDRLHDEVARVLRRGEARRIGARRHGVA